MDDVLNTAHRSILMMFDTDTEAKEVSFVGSPNAADDTMQWSSTQTPPAAARVRGGHM